MRRLLAGFLLILSLCLPARAETPARFVAAPGALQSPGAVDVALVLAVDVSSSVSPAERRFQRAAYAAALEDPYVQYAIFGGRRGQIALGYMEWSSPGMQNISLPVRTIASPEDLSAFAATLYALATEQDERDDGWQQVGLYTGTTAIGNALGRAAAALAAYDQPAAQYVIDISGDGLNNDGVDVVQMRDQLVAEGIVINALPIWVEPPVSSVALGGGTQREDLVNYYAECVVGGAGAFHVVAEGWDDMIDALRAKLVLELAGLDPERRQAAAELVRDSLRPEASLVQRVEFRLDLAPRAAQPDPVDCAQGSEYAGARNMR